MFVKQMNELTNVIVQFGYIEATVIKTLTK